MGNAGLTSAVAGLILTFYQGSGQQVVFRLGLIIVGLTLLWVISTSKYVDRVLTKIIENALKKFTKLEVRDYARLLELEKGYTVSELEVRDEEWLCNHKLHELALPDEGVVVLGIKRRNGAYIGAPCGSTLILSGDVLTCYGREKVLQSLATRSAGSKGDAEHAAAKEEQRRIENEESGK